MIKIRGGDSAANGGGAGRGSCGRAGILCEAAHNERNEEQQPSFKRGGVLDADGYGAAAPSLAVEVSEFRPAVSERVALALASGRAQRQLAAVPAELAAASDSPRFE